MVWKLPCRTVQWRSLRYGTLRPTPKNDDDDYTVKVFKFASVFVLLPHLLLPEV